MTATIRAELLRHRTRWAVLALIGLAGLIGFAMLQAIPQGEDPMQGFRDVSVFLSLFLMGWAATTAAGDHRSGTLRPWLISQPRRGATFVGKLVAVTLAATAAATTLYCVALVAQAPSGRHEHLHQLVTTGAWFLVATIALTWLGHSLGSLLRSAPAALAVALGWILPGEAVLSARISHAQQWLPGLLLRTVTAGTPAGLPVFTVLCRSSGPFLFLEILAALIFWRRDVTS